jgi:hypothetical protein
VVGFRLFATGTIYNRGIHRLEVSLAASPAMQGLENDGAAERASLLDGSLRWSVDMGRYAFVYGVRYINYSAAYTDANELADRNHLFMPFAGVEFPLHHRPSQAHPRSTARAPLDARSGWRFGAELLGANGARTTYGSESATPIPFVLLPQFALERRDARYIVAVDAIPSNDSADLFGSLGQRWNYVRARALLRVNRRLAFGAGEETVNYRSLGLAYLTQTARSNGLAFVGEANLENDVHGKLDATLDAAPYLHLRSYEFDDSPFFSHPYSTTTYQHGSRVDTSLTRTAYERGFELHYGLRYLNQTTNYGFRDLTRTFSLVPFAGISARL